ncbi:hypothetical protein E2562_036734 [Oryza meyeriana var. granulata]|uniref:DUF834 domain-containing protein n=1 Tax=Oryza meyeriana var. granulata TaxID=110450 RepID=A0A6G1DSE8_9ORYZ|nr:hypothetical protein E2562_036734 [Oryza meyeriana var. granulata]
MFPSAADSMMSSVSEGTSVLAGTAIRSHDDVRQGNDDSSGKTNGNEGASHVPGCGDSVSCAVGGRGAARRSGNSEVDWWEKRRGANSLRWRGERGKLWEVLTTFGRFWWRDGRRE